MGSNPAHPIILFYFFEKENYGWVYERYKISYNNNFRQQKTSNKTIVGRYNIYKNILLTSWKQAITACSTFNIQHPTLVLNIKIEKKKLNNNEKQFNIFFFFFNIYCKTLLYPSNEIENKTTKKFNQKLLLKLKFITIFFFLLLYLFVSFLQLWT